MIRIFFAPNLEEAKGLVVQTFDSKISSFRIDLFISIFVHIFYILLLY
jgi:hypothetical protein